MMVNSYLHASTMWAMKMSKRYFPLIEKTLKEEGIPDDFKYLAVAESNLMNATSPVGAKGVWQFMPGTAKEMGLTLTAEIDERYHIVESTRAASKYLKQLYDTNGRSWSNAAAAYNVGPGRLKSTMGLQGESSYYDMSLNEETSRYLFRILAIKEIISSPESYGFYLEESDYFAPHQNLKTVLIDQTTSLSSLAKQNNLTFKMLKYYNPWLISDKLTITTKNYKVLIPK
jgi:membrane-bound lytic murein transglycosylase D